MKGVFVTGTGTCVGKTVVCGLRPASSWAQGMRVTTQKWVETGVTDGPSDIDVHRRLMGDPDATAEPPLADRCPYRFSLPASPHLAAAREKRRVDPAVIEAAYRRLAETHDAVLVEGAGGFLVPLSEELLTGDLVARIGLPVLVVVGNRLGCVNDVLLTVEAVRRRGIPLLGLALVPPPGRRGRDGGGGARRQSADRGGDRKDARPGRGSAAIRPGLGRGGVRPRGAGVSRTMEVDLMDQKSGSGRTCGTSGIRTPR